MKNGGGNRGALHQASSDLGISGHSAPPVPTQKKLEETFRSWVNTSRRLLYSTYSTNPDHPKYAAARKSLDKNEFLKNLDISDHDRDCLKQIQTTYRVR